MTYQSDETITFNELPQAVSQLIKEVGELKSLLQNVHDNKVEPDRWFNIDQLCQYVPDKPANQTVYGWVARHEVPYHKKGKKLQFLKSEIDEWLKSDKRKTETCFLQHKPDNLPCMHNNENLIYNFIKLKTCIINKNKLHLQIKILLAKIMRGNLWTREEMILAFNLYLKLPFGKLHKGTPEIIELAQLIGRSVNSVALRLVNYASCDPQLQSRGISGMKGGQKQCQPIWDEFANNREALIFESERILAERQNQTIETKFDSILSDIRDLKGETKIREVKTRVNQNVFRQMVLVNYNKQCALTGIDIPELLFASHIIPWSSNEQERLNPENGICLSALYDKAFDKGLIGFNSEYKVVLSPQLKKYSDKDYYAKYFLSIDDVKLLQPQKYMPNLHFLEWHMDCIFQR